MDTCPPTPHEARADAPHADEQADAPQDDAQPDVDPVPHGGLPVEAGDAPPPTPAAVRQTAVWAIPVALLFGIWLRLAFSSGGYVQSRWLLPGLVLALF